MRRFRRHAFTTTELIVAAGLLVSAMAVIGPLTLQSGRLLQSARHQNLAMDELSNQLDRLLSLGPQERARSIADLQPSSQLKGILPSATITAETVDDQHGRRLVVSLNWLRHGESQPLALTGWLETPTEEAP